MPDDRIPHAEMIAAVRPHAEWALVNARYCAERASVGTMSREAAADAAKTAAALRAALATLGRYDQEGIRASAVTLKLWEDACAERDQWRERHERAMAVVEAARRYQRSRHKWGDGVPSTSTRINQLFTALAAFDAAGERDPRVPGDG